MKQQLKRYGWLAAALLGVALASQTGRAAQDIQFMPSGIQTNGDPTATGIGNWGHFWITTTSDGLQHATQSDSYDSTMHSATTIPGAIYCVCDWDGTYGDDINFGATLPNGGGTWLGDPNIQVIDGTQYAYLMLDIFWTNVTGITTWGTIGLMTPGYGIVSLTNNIPIPTTLGWQHLVLPIDPSLPNLSQIAGFCIYRWANPAPPSHAEFWVDNVQLIARSVPQPPPTVGLKKAGPSGVMISLGSSGGQWDRQAISTPAPDGSYIWTAQGGYPVSYSCTVTDFPPVNTHLGYEAHMYVVNGDTAGSGNDTSGSPDWGCPDLLIFRIENVRNTITTTNGTDVTTNYTYDARAQIQWKTNYPNANATNVPVVVHAPGVLGTWTVTFSDATHGSLSGPGITTTNFTLPSDAVASNFSPATSFVQFGCFKNDGANDGHNDNASGTYSHVTIAGNNAPIDDDFSGLTLTNKYAWRKTSANEVQYVPPGTAWFMSWSAPATGFHPYLSASPQGPWAPLSMLSASQVGASVFGPVLGSALPAGNAAFFKMAKYPFVKLQVLVPGETAAPNTTTGKTGTPDQQTSGVQFNVTVNAVDEFWNVVPSTDMIHITSSDSSAFLPADAALVNGTQTFQMLFLTSGATNTVTATDVTDSTKTADTSSPIAVP